MVVITANVRRYRFPRAGSRQCLVQAVLRGALAAQHHLYESCMLEAERRLLATSIPTSLAATSF
eukprot:6186777-Pleurochrysis_carterae.AAC.4